LAIDGSTAVIPSPSNGARVYERDPITFSWNLVAVLNTSADQAAAIQGDWIALARGGFNPSPTSHNAGYVDVFHKVNGTWQGDPVQTLRPPDTDAAFGSALALGGNVIAVGDSKQGVGAGAAYVYRRGGSSWAFETKFVGAQAAAFGEGVALTRDGRRLAIAS